VGDSQVVVARKPKNIKVNKKEVVSFTDATLSLFSDGEQFQLDN